MMCKFQDFKAAIENQIGKRIIKLRSDNGGKFTSINFEEFWLPVALHDNSRRLELHPRMVSRKRRI